MDKQNRIFVGGIPVRVDKKVIVDFFGQYGKILHCKIKKNSKTGRSLGYAYLTFENPQATKALINRQIEFYGRICECKQVFKKEQLKDELLKEKKRKLLVYKLDPTVTNTELKNLFESLTSISHAYVVKDPDSDLNLGYGYVVFHDEEAVETFRKLKLVVTLKGKRILYTNQSHLPPKKSKLSVDSNSVEEEENSKPSQLLDSEFSESQEISRRSMQGHNSPIVIRHSHGNSMKSNQMPAAQRQKPQQTGQSSIVSDLAEAGDSIYHGNSISGTTSHLKFTNGHHAHLQGHVLERENGTNGIRHQTTADKDNTGYTQTTKISSKQGGWAQLPDKYRINHKSGVLADVLRACPYLNHNPENYKFNYISRGRALTRPAHNHIFEITNALT
jgi:RNA recognition motif-containing protein